MDNATSRGDSVPESQVAIFDYEQTGPIRQRQKHLSDSKVLLIADKYRNGETVYRRDSNGTISKTVELQS